MGPAHRLTAAGICSCSWRSSLLDAVCCFVWWMLGSLPFHLPRLLVTHECKHWSAQGLFASVELLYSYVIHVCKQAGCV